MAKTNPIGVRFRTDILEKLENDHKVEKPQQALIFMENFYVQYHKLATDVTQVLRKDTSAENDEVIKSLIETRDAKIPPERNTPFGKKSWEIDRQKKIEYLLNKLK